MNRQTPAVRRREQFFAPIPTTFTRPKPKIVKDQDLLRAWWGTPTAQIADMVDQMEGRLLTSEDARVLATRKRVLTLRIDQEKVDRFLKSWGFRPAKRVPKAGNYDAEWLHLNQTWRAMFWLRSGNIELVDAGNPANRQHLNVKDLPL